MLGDSSFLKTCVPKFSTILCGPSYSYPSCIPYDLSLKCAFCPVFSTVGAVPKFFFFSLIPLCCWDFLNMIPFGMVSSLCSGTCCYTGHFLHLLEVF